MLHVAQISFFVDPERRAPDRLLADWHSLPDVACAAAAAGLRVSVVQASSVEGSWSATASVIPSLHRIARAPC
jgi:hypothetical protein